MTKEIAEQALGTPVGAPTQRPGQGNEACNYSAADKSVTARVYPTTYAAKGSEAALDQASAQFKHAYAVHGVGMRARQHRGARHRVLEGDVVFGIGLIPPSQDSRHIAPVTEGQMVKLANAVLAGM